MKNPGFNYSRFFPEKSENDFFLNRINTEIFVFFLNTETGEFVCPISRINRPRAEKLREKHSSR